ncbi:MAG: hypothetical protein ACK55I_00525, partial [bacterium]
MPQSKMTEDPSQANLPSPGAMQPTSYNPGWRGQFGLLSDISKNMPTNPGGWNDSVESLRQGGIKIVGGTLGQLSEQTLGRADKATNGGVTKLLMAGPKNVRSNYAFVRAVEDNSAAMGLFAGLALVAGAVAGGIAGLPLGPAGVAGGASIGAALAGKGVRTVGKTGAFGLETAQAATLAESEAGQQQYNYGRDATRIAAEVAARVTGYNKVGEVLSDTDKGVGAIMSGLLN